MGLSGALFYPISGGRVATTCLNMMTLVQLYGVRMTVYQTPYLYHMFQKRHFKGGFGTNSKRSDGTLRSNTVDVLPGPGHYEIRTDMKTNKPSESAFGTSCFTSMSNRMQNSLKAQVKRPPIFETSQSWDSKCNLRNLYPLHGNTTSKIIQLNRNANG